MKHKDEIENLVFKELRPCLVGLTETHVTNQIQDHELRISGYECVRGDSESTRTGGVLVYIDKRIRFEIKAIDKCEGNWWSIIINIQDRNCKGIVMVVYHSPNSSDSNFLDYLENTCNDVILRLNVIIMGDFNIDLKIDNYIQRRLINNMYSIGLKQLVNDFIRIVRTSETIIDLVFFNDDIEVEVRHD